MENALMQQPSHMFLVAIGFAALKLLVVNNNNHFVKLPIFLITSVRLELFFFLACTRMVMIQP